MYCKYKHDHSSEEVWVTTENPNPRPHGKERPFHCEKCHYVKKDDAWWNPMSIEEAKKQNRGPCEFCF